MDIFSSPTDTTDDKEGERVAREAATKVAEQTKAEQLRIITTAIGRLAQNLGTERPSTTEAAAELPPTSPAHRHGKRS